jgi:hypothetical protein
MIYHFDTIYKRDDSHTDARAFLNSYWIDSCTVSAIADFLRTSGQHDGIRIYFGCALQNDPAYGTDQYKKKSTLFIFPTIKRTSTSPEVSEHGDNLIPIPIPTTCLFRSEYIKPAGSATAEIGEFSKVYCKSTNPVAKQKDSLSKAIWIDSCVIYFIQKTLRKNSATVDGINIRTAAYFDNFTTTIKGRFKPNQSTIIIVPSSPGATGSHTDNWQITEDIFNVTKRIKKIKGAFNHGELCPKACE